MARRSANDGPPAIVWIDSPATARSRARQPGAGPIKDTHILDNHAGGSGFLGLHERQRSATEDQQRKERQLQMRLHDLLLRLANGCDGSVA